MSVRPTTPPCRDELFDQLARHFYVRIEASADVRAKRWANQCRTPDEWSQFVMKKREAYLDLVGRFEGLARRPLNPRTAKIYDTEDYVGYKTLLDVFDGVETVGILLVPNRLQGRQPAVICQHGYAAPGARYWPRRIGPILSSVRP